MTPQGEPLDHTGPCGAMRPDDTRGSKGAWRGVVGTSSCDAVCPLRSGSHGQQEAKGDWLKESGLGTGSSESEVWAHVVLEASGGSACGAHSEPLLPWEPRAVLSQMDPLLRIPVRPEMDQKPCEHDLGDLGRRPRQTLVGRRTASGSVSSEGPSQAEPRVTKG